MDSLYKAWQLATILYYSLKELNALETGAPKPQLINTRVFNRVGTDPRTQEKYWNIMLKEGFMKHLGNGKYTVVENIEELKPLSLGAILLRARDANKQRTLDEVNADGSD